MFMTYGAQDALRQPDISKRALHINPSAQLSIYPEAGHTLLYPQPERFNSELLAFAASGRDDLRVRKELPSAWRILAPIESQFQSRRPKIVDAINAQGGSFMALLKIVVLDGHALNLGDLSWDADTRSERAHADPAVLYRVPTELRSPQCVRKS